MFEQSDADGNTSVNPINAQYANYGHIPYGQSIVGRLYYNPDNRLGCDKTASFTDDLSGDPDQIISPIFMVDRGDCSFVTKTRNIARAGGALALIVDNNRYENIDNIIMSDDGSGAGLRVPAMLISY